MFDRRYGATDDDIIFLIRDFAFALSIRKNSK